MSHPRRLKSALSGLIVVIGSASANVGAQSGKPPNPYHEVANWAKLPAGATWGGVISVDPAADGDVWVLHRSDPPILRFDQSGKVVTGFGGGMIVQAHGMTLDRDGSVWVTDAQIKDGKGNQVFKFSPKGTLLMTLGKAGIAGGGNDVFSGPCDVIIGENGDIFVADGHIADSPVSRIVKFSKDGKFIKAWGKRGSAAGEFDTPHSLAMDSRGRIFVADRGNSPCRSSIRTGASSINGSSSAGRAACSSTRTTPCTSPIHSQTASRTRASREASGSAAPRMAR